MHRFIVKPTDIKDRSVQLDPKESHHALKVLRLQNGDAVQILDGMGTLHSGFISDTTGARVQITLDPNSKKTKAVGVRVILACAMIKADHMEWMIEKACELGVSEIRPLMTERCVVRLDADERESKQKRWQKIAEASCKQCGLSEIPHVLPPQKWKDFLSQPKDARLRLIASLAKEALPLKTVLAGEAAPKDVLVVVGPEGDFTEGETAAALEAGFKAVNLGNLVMRSETAAIYALSVVKFEYCVY